jgi:hypothetical protein
MEGGGSIERFVRLMSSASIASRLISGGSMDFQRHGSGRASLLG